MSRIDIRLRTFGRLLAEIFVEAFPQAEIVHGGMWHKGSNKPALDNHSVKDAVARMRNEFWHHSPIWDDAERTPQKEKAIRIDVTGLGCDGTDCSVRAAKDNLSDDKIAVSIL